MRSLRSPLSPPACSRRSARIRCPSPCTRGALPRPASPRPSPRPKASPHRPTSWKPRGALARVAMESREGRAGEHLQPRRKGDPDMPLSDAELEHKYLELASPVLGEEQARTLLARLWKLDRESRL